jgi:hypothetical protein
MGKHRAPPGPGRPVRALAACCSTLTVAALLSAGHPIPAGPVQTVQSAHTGSAAKVIEDWALGWSPVDESAPTGGPLEIPTIGVVGTDYDEQDAAQDAAQSPSAVAATEAPLQVSPPPEPPDSLQVLAAENDPPLPTAPAQPSPSSEAAVTPEASAAPEATSTTPEATSTTPEATSTTPEATSTTPEATSTTPEETSQAPTSSQSAAKQAATTVSQTPSSTPTATSGPTDTSTPESTSSATETPTPTPTPSDTPSTTETPTPGPSRDTTLALGEIHQETDASGKTIFSIALDSVAVDLTCTADASRSAKRGHLVGLNVRVLSGPETTVSAADFQFLGSDGDAVTDVATTPAAACLDETGSWPGGRPGPDQPVAGTIVVDVPAVTGTIVYRPATWPASLRWHV